MNATRRTAIVAVSVAALLVPAASASAHGKHHHHVRSVACSAAGVDVSDAIPGSWETAQYLLAAGWKGNPRDHREMLYPPTCVR